MPYSLLLNACTVHTFCNYTVQLKPNTNTCIHIRTYVRTDKDQQIVKKALTYVLPHTHHSLLDCHCVKAFQLLNQQRCAGNVRSRVLLTYSYTERQERRKHIMGEHTGLIGIQHIIGASWSGLHTCWTHHLMNSSTTPSLPPVQGLSEAALHFSAAKCSLHTNIVRLLSS